MREKMRSLLLKIGWCLLGAIICIFLTNIYNYLTCSDEEKLLLEIKKDLNQYSQREELPEEIGNGYINNNPNKILVRTAAIDGKIYDQQKEYHYLLSKINIGGQEKSGLSANFLINPNKVYDISYHVDKYKDDIDDFYIDKGLFEISENAIEIVLQTGGLRHTVLIAINIRTIRVVLWIQKLNNILLIFIRKRIQNMD